MELYQQFNFDKAPEGVLMNVDLSKVMVTYDIPVLTDTLRIETYGGHPSLTAVKIKNGIPGKELFLYVNTMHRDELLIGIKSESDKIYTMYQNYRNRNFVVTKRRLEDKYLSTIEHHIGNSLSSLEGILILTKKRSGKEFDGYCQIANHNSEIKRQLRELFSNTYQDKEIEYKKRLNQLFENIDGFMNYFCDNLDNLTTYIHNNLVDLKSLGYTSKGYMDSIFDHYDRLNETIPKLREAEGKYSSLDKLL